MQLIQEVMDWAVVMAASLDTVDSEDTLEDLVKVIIYMVPGLAEAIRLAAARLPRSWTSYEQVRPAFPTSS